MKSSIGSRLRRALSALSIPVLALTLAPAAFGGAPKIAVFNDDGYTCQGCGGTFRAQIFLDTLHVQYPDVDLAPTIADIPAKIAGVDAFMVPYMESGKNLDADMTQESRDAVKRLVTGGGRLIVRMDYRANQTYALDLVDRIFGVRLSMNNFAIGPNIVCDTQKMHALGWEKTPTSLPAVFWVMYASTYPDSVIPLCKIENTDNLVLGAIQSGDGLVYLNGLDNLGPTDLTDNLKDITHEMIEGDLIGRHLCFADGSDSKCSGSNRKGQLGVGDQVAHILPFRDLPKLDLGQGFAPVRVEGSSGFSCALSAAGALKCWGQNDVGQLALGDVRPRGANQGELGDALPAVNFGHGNDTDRVLDYSLGRGFACAITAAKELRCWGRGDLGQLGNEQTVNLGDEANEQPSLVNLGQGVVPKAVTLGREHACVLLDDASVACFGGNSSGQLGIGATTSVGDHAGTMGSALRRVNLGSDFKAVQIASGDYHSCALSDQGQVKCWGGNSSGQLGLGTLDAARGVTPEQLGDALPFVDLGENQDAQALSCGSAHCCVITLENTMKCWGENTSGQLGLGDNRSRGRVDSDMGDELPFVRLPPRQSVKGLSIEGSTTCVETDDGVRCWGENSNGQLATGDRDNRGDSPATLPRLLSPLFTRP